MYGKIIIQYLHKSPSVKKKLCTHFFKWRLSYKLATEKAHPESFGAVTIKVKHIIRYSALEHSLRTKNENRSKRLAFNNHRVRHILVDRQTYEMSIAQPRIRLQTCDNELFW